MSEAIERDEERAAEDVLVEVEDLKTYYDTGLTGTPVKAVDGVSLSIRRGETLGLVGESGCGKTTLGRTLVQLEDATDGTVRFAGNDIDDLRGKERKYWQRNTQIVFQDPESSLNERMTIGEIIREPLDVHDWPTLAVAVEGADAAVTGNVVAAAAGAEGRDVDLTVRVDGGEPTVEVRDAIPLSADDVVVSVDRGRDGPTVDVRVRKAKSKMRRAHVRNLLETVGLREEHYYRYPHQFSGGQRQRI
ncbi:MAG: ATP-binding cassette domain-containing protein, partial [Halobacteriales archaeon]